jgi:hypothetical protein
MDFFQTKSPNLSKFWRALEWKMLVYFTVIWSILRRFGIPILWPYGNCVYFSSLWYIVSRKIWQPWRMYAEKEYSRNLNLAILLHICLQLRTDGRGPISKA